MRKGVKLLATLVVVVGWAAVGCSGNDTSALKPPKQSPDVQKKSMVETIKNNPNMPEEAKEKALAAMNGAGHPH